MKARFPLREARVEVKEIPGKPGSYNAVAYLRPWLQMEELTTSCAWSRAFPRRPDRPNLFDLAPAAIIGGTGTPWARKQRLQPRTAQAPQQRRPLRESVLDGRFFGQQDSGAAGELAAFLHGKLGFGEALEAWFGEAVTGLLAAGGDRLRAALDRDIADIDAALGDQLDAVLHHPRSPGAGRTLARHRLVDLRHRAWPARQGAVAARLMERALP